MTTLQVMTKPCKRGHLGYRYRSGGCVDCVRQAAREVYERNPAPGIDRSRKRYAETPELVREESRQWRAKNRARSHALSRNWRQANKARWRALQAKRRADKLRATPKWLAPEQRAAIIEIYERAEFLRRMTGRNFQVDHIQPLRGKDRSGLHVPWNLQVLSADENNRKNARTDYVVHRACLSAQKRFFEGRVYAEGGVPG